MLFSEKDSKNKDNRNIDRIQTLIGEHCSIVGNLSGSGLLKIDGSVDGDTIWKDDLILGIFSSCNGNISCKNAFISGKVNGNILCEETLTIESTGKVMGNITAKNLVIKEGGYLDGKCTMMASRDLVEILNT